ncbi:MAG: biopolymer transporter ExbD [Bacteroidales bacterium]|jgi:biopolymer transport protein ExbD|nr:biopolymer transporter ExbD [Bacteroidales bacterium]HNT40871.1 biopolymer transporter ExbD [Tenuifilaceae bacterium]HOA08825.1 biopolymer transporter ExbD [Tenuifilaceae bacterium]HOG71493.1 biopolymer transporter ExbD [Tenuifilaceae bacterium]HPA66537.1 biopolymer transporter ExbD [Tenuifilaceae bacterium]
MPKIKLGAKSPRIDMTPMVDLFTLLLTFFILTATFRPQESAPVDTPFSVSEKPIMDANVMTVLIAKDKRVFFNIDNGPDTILKFRPKVLAEMGKRYNIEFNEAELRQFEKSGTAVGVPIQKMKEYLNTKNSDERRVLETGVPIDSTDNQLALWILFARQVNPAVQTMIKGDADLEFPVVREILSILQDKNVNRYSLVTNLRAVEVKEDEIAE